MPRKSSSKILNSVRTLMDTSINSGKNLAKRKKKEIYIIVMLLHYSKSSEQFWKRLTDWMQQELLSTSQRQKYLLMKDVLFNWLPPWYRNRISYEKMILYKKWKIDTSSLSSDGPAVRVPTFHLHWLIMERGRPFRWRLEFLKIKSWYLIRSISLRRMAELIQR